MVPVGKRRDRSLSRGKHQHEAVALSAQFAATVIGPRLTQDVPLTTQRLGVGTAKPGQQHCGALDVGEQQRHRPRRQLHDNQHMAHPATALDTQR
jgi:hypothetical protein